MANGNNPVSTVDPTGGTGYSGGSGGGYGGGGSPGGPGGGSGYASMYGMLGFAPGGYQNAYGSSGSGASDSNANAGGYALANLISGGQTEIGVYAARPQTFSGSNYSGGSMYASNLASTAGTASGTGNLGGNSNSGNSGGAPMGFNDGRGGGGNPNNRGNSSASFVNSMGNRSVNLLTSNEKLGPNSTNWHPERPSFKSSFIGQGPNGEKLYYTIEGTFATMEEVFFTPGDPGEGMHSRGHIVPGCAGKYLLKFNQLIIR